ncbi:hypothetical protein KIW84_051169 [Lathyrus oleraceus]|uniref:Uncharacterized protein n=1 Tax=Pisum sativum TaxID=3888 RepID=A0A9D5AD86_PEA|nr:hypothetical protein KIW84_051169 [Pisum sativum]
MLTFVVGFQELPRWLFGGKRLFLPLLFPLLFWIFLLNFFIGSSDHSIGTKACKVTCIERDAGCLIDCRARMKFSPLGACALAGTGLPIDRFMISDALGFIAPMRNRKDAKVNCRRIATWISCIADILLLLQVVMVLSVRIVEHWLNGSDDLVFLF